MTDPKREPEPAFGPDEEGEIPVDPPGPERKSAWVHRDEPPEPDAGAA